MAFTGRVRRRRVNCRRWAFRLTDQSLDQKSAQLGSRDHTSTRSRPRHTFYGIPIKRSLVTHSNRPPAERTGWTAMRQCSDASNLRRSHRPYSLVSTTGFVRLAGTEAFQRPGVSARRKHKAAANSILGSGSQRGVTDSSPSRRTAFQRPPNTSLASPKNGSLRCGLAELSIRFPLGRSLDYRLTQVRFSWRSQS